MLNDIFKEVAREKKIPEEQVKMVYKSFTDCARYFILNPFYSKSKIRIPFIGSFRITYTSAKSSDDREELLNYIQQFKRNERKKERFVKND